MGVYFITQTPVNQIGYFDHHHHRHQADDDIDIL